MVIIKVIKLIKLGNQNYHKNPRKVVDLIKVISTKNTEMGLKLIKLLTSIEKKRKLKNLNLIISIVLMKRVCIGALSMI